MNTVETTNESVKTAEARPQAKPQSVPPSVPLLVDTTPPASETGRGGQYGSTSKWGRRMLYRSPDDKIAAGVAGGLAEFLGWNPVIVRVLWVVATFATWGGGILAYVLLAMFLPVGNNRAGQMRPPAVELSNKGVTWAAGILMAVGGLWLLGNLGILPGLWRGVWTLVAVIFWPALLIAAGYLLFRANSNKDVDKTVTDAAQKVKDSVGSKMPSGDQMKSGYDQMRRALPLQRSRTNRMFLGVCGGMADKYGIDANLVRLIWAAFAIGTMGLGALFYFLVGLVLPEGPAVPATTGGRNGSGPDLPQDIRVVDGTAERKG